MFVGEEEKFRIISTSRVDDVCVVGGKKSTKICFESFSSLLSPMPFDAIDFNGSKFWHFCDMKEIEIWKSQERNVEMFVGERRENGVGGYIVVNIIKPIHNNHKFFVERMKKKPEKQQIKSWNGKNLSIQSKIAFSLRRQAGKDFRDFHFDLNLN